MKSIAAAVVTVLMLAAQPSAQWAKVPDKTIPRTPDGKPNLSARTPKAPNGKTDLSGVWLPDNDSKTTFLVVEHTVLPAHFIDITANMKPEDVPFQPWAAALFRQRLQSAGKEDPSAHCKPTGVPAINTAPIPYKIIQTPRLVLILYEDASTFRQIFLDSRKTVQDAVPRFMGYSTGRWDGDTLVVDTVGFNDKYWLDRMGHPNSDGLHLIERFRRRDVGHLDIEMTIDDPKTYTKPITYTQKTTLIPDEDLLEYFCSENEKDVQHFR